MSKILLLSLLIYGLVFGGLATLNNSLLVLVLPLIVYLGAGLLFRPEEIRLHASRSLSTHRVAQDEPVDVTLTITNEGGRLSEVVLEDLVPAGLDVLSGQTALLTSLSPGATVKLNYTLSGRRGSHHLPGVRVTANDDFGIFKRQVGLPVASELLILPEVVKLRRVEIRPRQTRVYSGPIPTRRGGPGVEFFGVREYQPGDPLRWINGKASARHPQALFINEFQQERVADVGLILDARQQSDACTSAGSLFEHGIQATAALADAFINAGNRVGLFIYGRSLDWTFPGYGKVQRERILRALANAELGSGQVFEKLEYLPTRLFPARSQLVFISPLLPQDTEELTKLRAHGYQLLVVSPDPVTFEHKTMGQARETMLAMRIARLERALLLNQLRHVGIRVMDWPVDTPFQQAAHVALSRLQYYRK
ncbi:MAG: DUF58 domain-containing protein [Anaerolineae bacterium]|nr:DUF58 domain-containing protein [Anaerolineae bacterium]